MPLVKSPRFRFRQKKKGNGLRVALVLVLFAVGAAVGLSVLRGTPTPAIELETSAATIGARGQVSAVFREPVRGLADVKLELIQGDLTRVLCQHSFEPIAMYSLLGEGTPEHRCQAEIGKEAIAELEEGAVHLQASATRASGLLFTPAPVVVSSVVKVDLTPPRIGVKSERIYVSQGGAEVVVYTVGEDAARSGVEVAGWFFPGYPLPGGAADERFALFAVPYNVASVDELGLMAEDALGNRAVQTGFVQEFFPHPPTTDTIRLSDQLLKKITEGMMPRVKSVTDKGDPLQNFLQLNGPLREQNRARLRELAGKSVARFLWSEPFAPMKNAAVLGTFADDRTYEYQGTSVDRQTHLGIDFASVARAPVEAANRGVVLHAGYLGIYGNSVVLDHGYGLLTLYGHLSSLAVQAGQEVSRRQELGKSGASGMAGGDHLHFAVLLQGLPTNPKEWWDRNWLNDRLKLKLGDALPFAGDPATD